MTSYSYDRTAAAPATDEDKLSEIDDIEKRLIPRLEFERGLIVQARESLKDLKLTDVDSALTKAFQERMTKTKNLRRKAEKIRRTLSR